MLQLPQVLLRLLGHSHYSTNSGGRWPGTFWAVLHQVLPKHEEIKITRRSLRNWLRKSTEPKSVQIPTFSPDRRKWRQGSLSHEKEIDLKSLNFWCKAIKMESRDGKGSRLSSGSQRQSSEFYAGDSTINYIWQVF